MFGSPPISVVIVLLISALICCVSVTGAPADQGNPTKEVRAGVALTKIIKTAGKNKTDDASCANALVDAAYENYARHKGASVLVFKLTQNYDDRLSEVSSFNTVTCNGKMWSVWTVKGGTFQNKGDGGWLNWAMVGCFDREGDGGKLVKFKPC